MSTEDNRLRDQTLSESQLTSLEVFLGTMSSEQLRRQIVDAYRRAMDAQLASHGDPVGAEKVQEILASIEPPEQLLEQSGTSTAFEASRGSLWPYNANKKPIANQSVVWQAKIGLIVSGVSGILLVCTPGIVIAALIVVNALTTGGSFFDMERSAEEILKVVYFAVIPLIAVYGTFSSFAVRSRLRREGGNRLSYKHATWGLNVGATTLLCCLLLFVRSLFIPGVE